MLNNDTIRQIIVKWNYYSSQKRTHYTTRIS